MKSRLFSFSFRGSLALFSAAILFLSDSGHALVCDIDSLTYLKRLPSDKRKEITETIARKCVNQPHPDQCVGKAIEEINHHLVERGLAKFDSLSSQRRYEIDARIRKTCHGRLDYDECARRERVEAGLRELNLHLRADASEARVPAAEPEAKAPPSTKDGEPSATSGESSTQAPASKPPPEPGQPPAKGPSSELPSLEPLHPPQQVLKPEAAKLVETTVDPQSGKIVYTERSTSPRSIYAGAPRQEQAIWVVTEDGKRYVMPQVSAKQAGPGSITGGKPIRGGGRITSMEDGRITSINNNTWPDYANTPNNLRVEVRKMVKDVESARWTRVEQVTNPVTGRVSNVTRTYQWRVVTRERAIERTTNGPILTIDIRYQEVLAEVPR